MSESRKAEKRRLRKEKKRQELEKKLAEEKVEFDVLSLLKNSPVDTKPNMAKFLSEHVQMMRAFVSNGKIQLWPSFKQEAVKVFVKFLDGHELIWNRTTDGKVVPAFEMCYELGEVKLSKADAELVEQFFQLLLKFGFIV